MPPTWRRGAAIVAGVAGAVVVALGIALHDGQDTGFDKWVSDEFYLHIGETGHVLLLGLSETGVSVGMLALVVAAALLARAWNVALLAIAGPLVAVGMTELILKPVVHRAVVPVLGGLGYPAHSYPSGHETGLVAMLTVLALLLARVRLGPVGRMYGYGVLVVWAVCGAVGLVRGFYHFATDTIGGVGVAVACVLVVAFAIDATAIRVDRMRRTRHPRPRPGPGRRPSPVPNRVS